MPFSDYIPEDFVLHWRNPTMAHVTVPLDFQFNVYESNNQPLRWSLINNPAWMSIDQYGRVTGTPTVRDHLTGVNVTVLVERPQGMLLSISRTFNIKVYDSDLGDTKVRFVSPTGNDSNVGSKSSPWRNIIKPLTLLSTGVGQLIYIRGGTYLEGYSWESGSVVGPFNSKHYSPTDHLEVRGYPGEVVIHDCNAAGHGLWLFQASYVCLNKIRQRNGNSKFGMSLQGASNCIITDCVSYDNSFSYTNNCNGITVRGRDNVVDRCVAYSNYDRADVSASTNNMNFIIYAEDGDVPLGGILWVTNCKAWDARCNFKIKHPGEKRIISHNIESFQADYGWAGISQYSSLRYAVCWNNQIANTSLGISDSNTGIPENGFMLVEHVTDVNSPQSAFQIQSVYATVNPVELRYNIFFNSLVAAGTSSGQNQLMQLWELTPSNVAQARQLTSDYNVFYSPSISNIILIGSGTGGPRNRSFSEWQGDGKDTHSRFGNPAFANLATKDFSILTASNAAAIMSNEYAGAFKPDRVYRAIGQQDLVLLEFQFPGDFVLLPPPIPPVIDTTKKRLHSQHGLARL